MHMYFVIIWLIAAQEDYRIQFPSYTFLIEVWFLSYQLESVDFFF